MQNGQLAMINYQCLGLRPLNQKDPKVSPNSAIRNPQLTNFPDLSDDLLGLKMP